VRYFAVMVEDVDQIGEFATFCAANRIPYKEVVIDDIDDDTFETVEVLT
jgi:hypothetical protein